MQFQIESIHCEGCVRSITRAITRLDAGATVAADLGTKTVTIASAKSRGEIEAALTDAGFPAAAA